MGKCGLRQTIIKHLFRLDSQRMKSFKFINIPQSFISDADFVVHLSGINNKEELFNQLSGKLEMPEYFGYNWDAISDCLRDFHWIEQQKIILVHDDLPLLNEHELSTYLQVLFEAVQDWTDGEEHSLEVVFSESVRSAVEQHNI
jgi:RNAse (barnase) inhibitor barstar